MTRSILLCVALLTLAIPALAQCSNPYLDYTGYHTVWEDNFRYPVLADEDSTTAFRHNPGFLTIWKVPAGRDSCDGYASTSDDTSQLTMPSHGILRITVSSTEPHACIAGNKVRLNKHVSGRLHSKAPYLISTGIIEARIKVPPYIKPIMVPTTGQQAQQTASPAFWTSPTGPDHNSRRNEIDIFDNHDGIINEVWGKVYSFYGKADSIRQESFVRIVLPDTTCFPGLVDLSEDFHIYSCVWTPSRATYYLDRRYLGHLDFEGTTKPVELLARTAPALQELVINLMAHEYTADGQTMEIDWVRYLEQSCNGDSLIITDGQDNSKVLPAAGILGPNMASPVQNELNYDKIIVAQSTRPVTALPMQATVLNARSTIITGNFLVDQSQTVIDSIRSQKTLKHPYVRAAVSVNGYLEITAKECASIPYAEIENDILKERAASPSPSNTLIYPNPSNGSFSINMVESGDYLITVTDIVGRIVYETKVFNAKTHNVSLGHRLNPGNYMVRITGIRNIRVAKATILR